MEERSISNARQESVHKRPVTLAEVTHQIITKQLLYLVGRVENEWELEKRELFLVCEWIVIAVEAIVEGHVDAIVELLIQELFPAENWFDDIDWMNLKWGSHTCTCTLYIVYTAYTCTCMYNVHVYGLYNSRWQC